MAFVLRRCRELYNAALQERRDAWQKCHKSIKCNHQTAQLPAIKDLRPEYHDVHSQVLQDVLTRLDRAFQAFFRRVKAGEKPGYPRFQGRYRYHSFTYKQYGNGARLDNGLLVLSNIGRVAVRWSRPLEPPAGRHTQDRHHLSRGGRVVCHHLVRRSPGPTAAMHRAGNGHRCRIEGLSGHGAGRRVRESPSPAQSGALSGEVSATGS